jgi:trans-aconitate methyltransferase
MPDPFSDIGAAPTEFLDQFAELMEQRAAHPRQIEMRDAYLDTIDFGEGRVLDVGCGGGPVTRALAARSDTTEVIGIDPSPEFIDYARNLDPQATYQVGDGWTSPSTTTASMSSSSTPS